MSAMDSERNRHDFMIDIGNFPNALAVLRASMQDMSISTSMCTEEGELLVREKKTGKKSKAQTTICYGTAIGQSSKLSKSTIDEIDEIWKALEAGRVDISYACAGYTLDGRVVIDQADFMSLLAAYGFNVNTIALFVDDFVKQTKDVKTAPILMCGINSAKILTEVVPLKKSS